MAFVKAKIRLEIEVEVGTWDDKATFGTLQPQVAREGLMAVRKMIADTGGKGRIVGEPQVVCVLYLDERK